MGGWEKKLMEYDGILNSGSPDGLVAIEPSVPVTTRIKEAR